MVPMQRIAAENWQSETAILVAPTDGAFEEDALMRPRNSVDEQSFLRMTYYDGRKQP
jgi:hypothetical protein